MKTRHAILLTAVFYILTACPVEDSPTVLNPPAWTTQPTIDSSVKGQFTLTPGTVNVQGTIVISYYWQLTIVGVEAPSIPAENISIPQSWTDVGWQKIPDSQLSEPIGNIKGGGMVYLYGLAVNSSGWKLTDRQSVEVAQPIGPVNWVTTPSIDSTFLDYGQLKFNEASAEGENSAELDPPGSLYYYYALYKTNPDAGTETKPDEPDENSNSITDWTDLRWTAFEWTSNHEKNIVTPTAGKYNIWAVMFNNGAALRHEVGIHVIEEKSPTWIEDPVIVTEPVQGSVTLTLPGVIRGNPEPDINTAKFYYGPDAESIPNDISVENNWIDTTTNWKSIRPYQTEENIVPAATDYVLYGVYSNSSGSALSNPVAFTVAGLGKWFEGGLGGLPNFSETQIVVHKGILYVIGGKISANVQNKVYRGAITGHTINWLVNTAEPPFGTIVDHKVISDGTYIYIIGGRSHPADPLTNRVWRGEATDNTADLSWTELSDDADWKNGRWDARRGHSAVIHNSNLFIMGGTDSNALQLSDVWKSADGKNWTRVVEYAGWQARRNASAVSFNQKLWIIAGLEGGTARGRTVWSSDDDGLTWNQATNPPWLGREFAIVFEFQNMLWIMGGYDGSYNLSDVWNSSDGENWFELEKIVIPTFGAHKLPGGIAVDSRIILLVPERNKLYYANWIDIPE